MNSSSMDDRTVLITQEPNQVNPTLTESQVHPNSTSFKNEWFTPRVLNQKNTILQETTH